MDKLQRPARLTVVESSSSTATVKRDQPQSAQLGNDVSLDEKNQPSVSSPRKASAVSGPLAAPPAALSSNYSSAKDLRASSADKPRLNSTTVSASGESEEAKLLRADRRRKDLLRKSEKWGDKMMEEVVDGLDDFRKGLRYITPSQYTLITHERHLNSLCSYSPCPNRPSAAYRPQKRFVISAKHRTITETMGNADEGFCSKVCRSRNSWVEQELGKAGPAVARGKDWTIQLLEDFENEKASRSNIPPRAVVQESVTSPQADLASIGRRPNPEAGPSGSPTRNSVSIPTTGLSWSSTQQAVSPEPRADNGTGRTPAPSVSPDPSVLRIPAPARPARPPAGSSNPPTAADLIASLTIHERPTLPLTAKSLVMDSTATAVPAPAQPAPIRSVLSPSPTTSRRQAPSLLATPSGLASTVLKASKTIGPKQLDPDSEDDAADPHLEWERDVGLEWGETDEEMRDVWEEARRAKEIMEQES